MNELQISQLKIEEDILFGREKEIESIQNVLNRVISKEQKSQILLISGSSGTGKSALARHLKWPTERIGGIFAYGKFDQNRVLPYSAFRDTFDKLCRSIESDKGIKEKIQDVLGSDGAEILADVIPTIYQLVADEKEQKARNAKLGEGYMESQNMFNYLIRSFLRGVSGPERPIVMVLDDLQWADESSLDLLETLVTDAEDDGGLLFVVCFRDKEDEIQNKSLIKRIDSITENLPATKLNRVHVDNLGRETVRDLVAEMLRADTHDTSDLADMVFDKTHGNAFFTIRFLQSLKEEGILIFNIGNCKWTYSLEKVRCQSVTENVAVFMVRSIQKLKEVTKLVLANAACLGAQFEARALQKIVELDNLEEILSECVVLGLLREEGGKTMFSFVHDQIQSAAKSLMPLDGQSNHMLEIGMKLLDKSTPEEREKDLFVIVDMLNLGSSHIADEEMLRRLAFLNFDAGKKSMSLSAFTSALSYLEATAKIVGEEGWDRNYHLCVEAFSLAAEAAYCTGNLDRLHHYVDTVLKHGVDIQDKFRVYDALIASLGSEAKYTEAVDTGLLALEQLGLELPKHPSKARVAFELLKTRKLLKPFSQEDLESLPVMTDMKRVKATRIMDKIGTYCYFVRQNLLAVVILRVVQWSIHYGICKNSASGFVAYGMILASQFCDLKGAYMFVQLGISIIERLGAKDMTTRVDFLTTTFINHWTKPAAEGVKPLIRAFRDGLAKTGDIENCMWCLQYAQGFMIESGQKLSLIHASYKTHKDIIRDYSQEIVWIQSFPWWQYIQNLMGLSKDPLRLNGEVMIEEEIWKRAKADKDQLLECNMYFLCSWLACYFNEYESALQFMKRARTLQEVILAHHWFVRQTFFEGLASFAYARKRKRHHLFLLKRRRSGRGEAAMKRLEKWIHKGNCNCVHLLLLLEAEKVALSGGEKAKEKFDAAIACAGKRGYVQDRALASERAGLFFLERKDEDWASYYLSMSKRLYVAWGAIAKAKQLDKLFPHLLRNET